MKAAGKDLLAFVALFRPHFRWMALGTGLGLGAIMASVGLLALAGWFLSSAAIAGLAMATAHLFNFFIPSIGVRLFAIARTLARYAERLTTHESTFRMLATLRVWFYRRIEPLAPARLMAYRSADILNRIVADIESLDNLYVRVLSPSVIAAGTIVSVVLLLAVFDWWTALTALVFMLVAGIVVPLAAGRAGAGAGRQLARGTSAIRITIVEGIQGLAELMVFGAWERQLAVLDKEMRALVRVQGRMSQIRGLATAATTLLTGLAVLACLYVGVGRIGDGLLDGANLALVGFAVLAAFEALLPLPWAYQYLGQSREAGKRLLELVNAPPAVVFPDRSADAIEAFDIAFDGIDFRYKDADPWAVKTLDLKFVRGQRVAILGETGAGKSTLFNLLVRFWDPVNGTVRIGGRDIRTFAESDLRRVLGVATQQSHLFVETLRENLLMARPGADETAMRAALQKAQLLDFVETLPQGLDTWIGEGGRALSGGQARRLTLARVFLQDAPVWVLDEPTEGLDRLTAEQVMRALFQATEGRTLVLITHRTAGLACFDEVVLLDQGRVAARGHHRELLETSEAYRALVGRGRVGSGY
jgi:ATP-binding cassette, subfamily C, bacterial CydC